MSYLPIKKRYYVVSMGTGYSTRELFHFKELEGALKMFKFLQTGEAIVVENQGIQMFKKRTKDDDTNYDYKYLSFEDQGKSEFHLTSKIIDIYTKDQIDAIEKDEAKKREDDDKKNKKKNKKNDK